jgi:hypothetical protein
MFNTISPEPASETSKFEAVMTSLFLKSPDPARETLLISLNGIVILIVLLLLDFRLI